MDEVIRFIKQNVREIKINYKFEELKAKTPEEEIVAIDGGSSKIVDGGAWAIGLVRIGKVKYNSTKKIYEERKNYWVGISDDKVKVTEGEKEIMVPVKIKQTEHPFETAINDVRKFLEWKAASEEKSLVLLDSILKPIETWQVELLKRIKKAIGIPKTTRESIGGRSIIGLILKHQGSWICKINDLLFVKFHPKSEYAYRVDLKGVKEDKLSEIAFFASDPELIGYPYPLLKVDKIARITREEKRELAFKIEEKLGDIFIDLKSQDMHKNLDMRAHRDNY